MKHKTKPAKKQKPVQKKSGPVVAKIASALKPQIKRAPATGSPQLVRGMKDILPQDQPLWEWVRQAFADVASGFGFDRIDTPIVEMRSLFERPLGTGSDVVLKEMYSFPDPGGEAELALRPEGTAGIVRAYIEHGMKNLPQPVKLSYIGPFFRHDRPQAGRQRQFHQASFELLGEAAPIADAEIIIATHAVLKDLSVPVTIQINSMGTKEERDGYARKLVDVLKPKRRQFCETCQLRLQNNPLRVLDCKESTCQELLTNIPQLVDFLDQPSRDHFMHVLEYLDEAQVPYILNNRIVRGFDYYTGTIFEIWPDLTEDQLKDASQMPVLSGAQNALGGGGRYDGLVQLLGGLPTPAVGVGLGIERVVLVLRALGREAPSETVRPDVFIAHLGDAARKRTLKLIDQLRHGGFTIVHNLAKDGLKPQLELANRRRCRYTLVMGQKEVLDGTLIIRDMDSGVQEVIDVNKVIPDLTRRLQKG